MVIARNGLIRIYSYKSKDVGFFVEAIIEGIAWYSMDKTVLHRNWLGYLEENTINEI